MANVKFSKGGVLSATEVSQPCTPSVLSDGSVWKLIFYHNNVGGTVLFDSAAEALHCNSAYKYSILDEMDKFRNADGTYEFLLYYPEVSTTQYNRWKQSINPTASFLGHGDGSKNVSGYTAVHIDWTSSYWGGLERQNQDINTKNACLLSGSTNHGNWFYAIGAYEKWNGGIPGPSPAINEVFLYERVDTTSARIYSDILLPQEIIEY